jgi:hypothetical protein
MSNTLGLDDDLDPVEALISLEKAFALKIRDEEAASCSTVGDIYDLLNSRFSTQIGEPGSCMTSMAFYRLRRSLREMQPGAELRPDTQLATYAGWNARAFLDRLQRESGLRLPGPQGQWLSGIGCLLLLLTVVGVVAVAAIKGPPILYLAAMALFAAGVVSIRLDPGTLSRDCATLGGLARKASTLNYGTLARSGGAVRPKELWDAMAEVLSGLSALPKSDMRRDTLILHQKV